MKVISKYNLCRHNILVMAMTVFLSLGTSIAMADNGTTVSFSASSGTFLRSQAGTSGEWCAFWKHEQAPLQLIESNSGALNSIGLFSSTANNMNQDSEGHLRVYSYIGQQNECYLAVVFPRGYRILNYHMEVNAYENATVNGKTNEDGIAKRATLRTYLMDDDHNRSITYGTDGDETYIYTIGTNGATIDQVLDEKYHILYFKLTFGDKKQHLTFKNFTVNYAVDDKFPVTIPYKSPVLGKENEIYTGFLNLGTFKTESGNSTKYFDPTKITDNEYVKAYQDGTTPDASTGLGYNVSRDIISNNYYYKMTNDGDYIIEAPERYRIVSAKMKFLNVNTLFTVVDGTINFARPDQGPSCLFDNNPDTKWCTDWDENTFVLFRTGSRCRITAYDLVDGKDTKTAYGRHWSKWTIYGGNFEDDDAAKAAEGDLSKWTIIDGRTGKAYNSASDCPDNLTNHYGPFDSKKTYLYYMVKVTGIGSGSTQQMADLNLTLEQPDYTTPAKTSIKGVYLSCGGHYLSLNTGKTGLETTLDEATQWDVDVSGNQYSEHVICYVIHEAGTNNNFVGLQKTADGQVSVTLGASNTWSQWSYDDGLFYQIVNGTKYYLIYNGEWQVTDEYPSNITTTFTMNGQEFEANTPSSGFDGKYYIKDENGYYMSVSGSGDNLTIGATTNMGEATAFTIRSGNENYVIQYVGDDSDLRYLKRKNGEIVFSKRIDDTDYDGTDGVSRSIGWVFADGMIRNASTGKYRQYLYYSVSESKWKAGSMEVTATSGDPYSYWQGYWVWGQDYTRLFDNDKTTKWCTKFDGSVYVNFQINNKLKLAAYDLVDGNDTHSSAWGRHWASWTLYGRNSSSSDWNVIDSHDDQAYTKDTHPTDQYHTSSFTIDNPKAYQYYKLVVNAVSSGNEQQMADINLTFQPVKMYLQEVYASYLGGLNIQEYDSFKPLAESFNVYTADYGLRFENNEDATLHKITRGKTVEFDIAGPNGEALNNDGFTFRIDGIPTIIKTVNGKTINDGKADFIVDLELLPLDPHLQTIQVTASETGNANAYRNYLLSRILDYSFDEGKTLVVVPPSTDTSGSESSFDSNSKFTIAFSDAFNENERTLSTGSKTSNFYLIGSPYYNNTFVTAPALNETGVFKSPLPSGDGTDRDGNTLVWNTTSIVGTTKIDFTNVNSVKSSTGSDTEIEETDFEQTKSSASNNPDLIDLSDAANHLGFDTEKTYYLYSADIPVYNVSKNAHIAYRFYKVAIKVQMPDEKAVVTPVVWYTTTIKGANNTNTTIPADEAPDTKHKYVGIKVTTEWKYPSEHVGEKPEGNIASMDIINAIKAKLQDTDFAYNADSVSIGDDLCRGILYIDMSALKNVSFQSVNDQDTWVTFNNKTADNCLYFMPANFPGYKQLMPNTVAGNEDDGFTACTDIVLRDKQPFFSPYQFYTASNNATYTREVSKVGAEGVGAVQNSTIILPFGVTVTDGVTKNGLTFRTLGTVTGSEGRSTVVVADPVEGDKTEANKAYHLSAPTDNSLYTISEKGATIMATYEEGGDVTYSDNDLYWSMPGDIWTAHGNYCGLEIQKTSDDSAEKAYYYSRNYYWNSKYLMDSSFYILPFRSYFTTTEEVSNSAKSLRVVFGIEDLDDDATAVETVIDEPTTVIGAYTISGIKVNGEPKQHGMYIVNGKKVLY